ncbi:MAG: helix-turn-helix transcriptional regulator [Lachnospiraceae bacterium]|nr:helix-turn-helix transcriptional regulator [Lachnospiraceae bacterium]
MIKFDRLWNMLKERQITQYQLIRDYGISRGQLDRLKKNENVTTNTLDILCNILNCEIGDICEHHSDENNRFRPDDYDI